MTQSAVYASQQPIRHWSGRTYVATVPNSGFAPAVPSAQMPLSAAWRQRQRANISSRAAK